ncbi:MAG: serine/threonine protein kinase, partial [Deltaproteobacteria bacterium]|nr:serine/threonine protein kinase [Deltaproteobacteria bacterium]
MPSIRCPCLKIRAAAGRGPASDRRQRSLAEQQDTYMGREILGQYQIEKKLGEGGMGMVFLADQPAMARKAAIKILRPELASFEQMERFQREAQTLSNIDHPHIIKVYNFGTLEEGELYIAMEFVQGRELDKVLEDEGRMPWERAVGIIIQAADALVEAHSKGIVHRDLKPENIMLCERRDTADYVKVMDFGIAKVLENNQELQSSATVQGII